MAIIERRRELLEGPKGRLPSGYKEIEYIQNSSYTNYIDTGFIPNNNTSWYYKFRCLTTELSDYDYVFGCEKKSSGTNDLMYGIDILRSSIRNSYFRILQAGGVIHSQILDDDITSNSIIEIDVKSLGVTKINNLGLSILSKVNGTIYKNEEITTYAESNLSKDYSMFLLSFNGKGTPEKSLLPHALYECKIGNLKWGTILHDYIPCVRKSDSMAGVYDIIDKQFLYGTGGFVAGPYV